VGTKARNAGTIILVAPNERQVYVAVGSGAEDPAFLDAVTVRDPSLAPSVDVLRRALAAPVSAEALLDVSKALRAIEKQLSMPPQRAP